MEIEVNAESLEAVTKKLYSHQGTAPRSVAEALLHLVGEAGLVTHGNSAAKFTDDTSQWRAAFLTESTVAIVSADKATANWSRKEQFESEADSILGEVFPLTQISGIQLGSLVRGDAGGTVWKSNATRVIRFINGREIEFPLLPGLGDWDQAAADHFMLALTEAWSRVAAPGHHP